MQVNEALQFDRNSYMEWLKFYFASEYIILMQPLESTGYLPLLDVIRHYVHDITDVYHTNGRSRKIQR